MNSVSTIKSAEPAKQADNIRPVVSSVLENAATAETIVIKLNELAKKRPFCCYLKNRKYDPL
jgi:hypothetical protein